MLKTKQENINGRLLRLVILAAGLLNVTQAFAAESTPAAGGRMTELTGTFCVIYADPLPESGMEPSHVCNLHDDKGVTHQLDIAPEVLSAAGGPSRLDRQRVRVTGRLTTTLVRQKVIVDSVSLVGVSGMTDGEAVPSLTTVTGSQPYAWILCRFADDPGTPEDVAWFETQAVSGHPSLDHYWREVSFNNINIVGSQVFGWYDLPEPRSYYVYDQDGDGRGDADTVRLRQGAISVSDPDIYFPDFIGMNLIFNDSISGCCSFGGTTYLTLDGETRFWGITWMNSPGGWDRHGVLAHEMGHALGLPHCSGPYDGTYDSKWGVMSAGDGTRVEVDPEYGSLAVHPISYHKDKLGWIPAGARYVTSASPEVQTIDLYNLAEVAPLGTYQIIKLPLYPTNPDLFYTVERRRMVGYDLNIPGDAVIINHVDPIRYDKPANVVDPDGDGDCNDEGAMFMPGETFYDPDNAIVVTVLWADYNSSAVTFTNAPFSPVYVDVANTGAEDGSAAYPYNTVGEGHAAVEPDGTMYIEPGTYSHSSTRLLGRPVTLRRNGTSGVVTIGTGL